MINLAMSDKLLTIFTPTYNREATLPRLYESLCRQTDGHFLWLVIDDGSTDGTKELVTEWEEQEVINIQYTYKENGGLHTGYNKAIELICTELCMCVDSDDWLPEDAVEKVISFWRHMGNDKVAGIMGLDYNPDGSPIGGYFPLGLKYAKIIDLHYKYHHYGDVKFVHRTELLKEVAPIPTFGEEKCFNPYYLFHQIDERYPLLVLNDKLCYVEYQEDGMSQNIIGQYLDSPRSFSELRKVVMKRKDAPWLIKFRNAIHYVSSQIMLRNKKWLEESPQKLMTVLAAPLGILLYGYIKYKVGRNDYGLDKWLFNLVGKRTSS